MKYIIYIIDKEAANIAKSFHIQDRVEHYA